MFFNTRKRSEKTGKYGDTLYRITYNIVLESEMKTDQVKAREKHCIKTIRKYILFFTSAAQRQAEGDERARECGGRSQSEGSV